MEIKSIIELMVQKPHLIAMNSDKLCNKFITNSETIEEAKLQAMNRLNLITSTEHTKKFPKILIMDIETSPMKAYVWRRWKQNIFLEQTISEWFMIGWAAKWLYSANVLSDVLSPEEILNENDKRIVTNLHKLIDEADIVIAHNGDSFDLPKINSRFIVNNLPPTKPYFSIDTKKIAAKQFGFSSNKLDALAGYFGIRHKDDTDFELWKNCMEGKQDALNYMEMYNKNDVVILEQVYLRLRPWIKNHPNVGNYIESDQPVCSYCGSDELELIKDDYYYTQSGKYPLYRCKCGAISRGRKTIKSREESKNLIVSVGK